MPPPSPTSAVYARAPFLLARLRRTVAGALIAGLVVCTSFAASAEETGKPDKALRTRITPRVYRPLLSAQTRRRPALLPQTRYTVQKQIESIEPTSWLERYGKVQVRRIQRGREVKR